MRPHLVLEHKHSPLCSHTPTHDPRIIILHTHSIMRYFLTLIKSYQANYYKSTSSNECEFMS
jgi:hypothetical protein